MLASPHRHRAPAVLPPCSCRAFAVLPPCSRSFSRASPSPPPRVSTRPAITSHRRQGQRVDMQTISGAERQGLFHTATPFRDEPYRFIVKAAKVSANDETDIIPLGSTIVEPAENMVQLVVPCISLKVCLGMFRVWGCFRVVCERREDEVSVCGREVGEEEGAGVGAGTGVAGAGSGAGAVAAAAEAESEAETETAAVAVAMRWRWRRGAGRG